MPDVFFFILSFAKNYKESPYTPVTKNYLASILQETGGSTPATFLTLLPPTKFSYATAKYFFVAAYFENA